VYGGTAGGVIAAVAAAREGASVILLEPGNHLGGMVSGGLGATDAGRTETIGGVAGEFFARLGRHYGKAGPTWRHEPSVAEATFRAMADEAHVTVRFGQALREKGGVTKAGARIVAVHTEAGETFAGKSFVDATYEGDLMAQAGVAYRVGREAQSEYDEPHAGVRAPHFSEAGGACDEQGLLPAVRTGQIGPLGAADGKTQAYNFRLCLTKDPANRVPIAKPDRYDPRLFTLLARQLKRGTGDASFTKLLSIAPLANGKTDVNNVGALSTDLLNASWDYPEATYARRREIWREHKDYVLGLLYFLANDDRVPEKVRMEAHEWGLAKDEFADTEHWPHQLYVREARRMVGRYVLLEKDLRTEIKKPDSIGMGSYFMDVHFVQRIALPDKRYATEGPLGGDHRVFPYHIPYRCITPKREQCENLLVPVCASASHVAWSSMRMEPVFMILGHSAGVAAAMSAKGGSAVQDVPYDALRTKLAAQQQILDWDMAGRVDPASLTGVVVDEDDADLKGSWLTSNSGDPFVGLGYRHDSNKSKGQCVARYIPDLPAAGRYEVRLFFSPLGNRATNVPVTVVSADGTRAIKVNQRLRFADAQRSLSLGTFAFAAGKAGSVTIANDGTDGVVVADAVQFLPPNAPATSPASSRAATTPSADAADPELLTAVRHCRDLIRAAQLPDGAMRMSVSGERVRIIPYFANNAAMALLAANHIEMQPEDVARVRRWIDWYAAHMEPDGTMYDFAGTTSSYTKTPQRDSTDSYAATFLQLVARYAKAQPSAAAALRPATEKALAAIELTYDPADGLTWAKPDYKIKYLMDNLEVALALTEAVPYFESVGCPATATHARQILEQNQRGMATYWQTDLGYFAWAKGTSGRYHVRLEKWYPDAVINLFAAAHVESVPPTLWDSLKAKFKADASLTPDWWLLAARRVGSTQDVAERQLAAIDFAKSMNDTSQLNRLATTVSALVDRDSPRVIVPLGRSSRGISGSLNTKKN
jgi:hypothetical protein